MVQPIFSQPVTTSSSSLFPRATLAFLLSAFASSLAHGQTPSSQPFDMKQVLAAPASERNVSATEEKPFSLGDALETLGRVYNN